MPSRPNNSAEPRKPDRRISVRLSEKQWHAISRMSSPRNTESAVVRQFIDDGLRRAQRGGVR